MTAAAPDPGPSGLVAPATSAAAGAAGTGATGSDADAAPRRLHPLSWLFVLLSRLRPFVLPALLLLVFGLGNSWELWGAVGAGVLALHALIHSLGFRYQFVGDELIVREGLLFRTVRHVPLARVQSVVQRRNALHRLCGVTELRLESSGGTRPEAVMNVITVAEAQRLEQLLRPAHGTAAPKPQAAAQEPAVAAPDAPAGAPEFALTLPDVLRLGLVSNRGWVIVGVAIGLYWQLAPADSVSSKVFWRWFASVMRFWHRGPALSLPDLGMLLLLVVGFAVLLKLMSMALSLLSFHGFRLQNLGGRLTTVSGLLTRQGASARADRIQRFVVGEPLLARLLGRRTLSCDVAVTRQEQGGGELARLHWLAPLGTPQQIDALIHELAPDLALDRRQWQPLHPGAWRRRLKVHLLTAVVAAAVTFAPLGPWCAVPAVLVAVHGWFAARGWARFAAWSLHDGVLAFRAGHLARHWTVARVRNGHVVALGQSPFDRRRGMASIRLDTSGAEHSTLPLRVPYLPVEVARAAQAELAAQLAARQSAPPTT